MSIEVMKLALAALETCRIRSVSEWSVEDITPKNVTAAIAALRTAIQQADVTDEREAFESCALMEGSLFKRRADDPDKYWYGGVQDVWELWQARAALSLRPERVPMTDDQVWNNDALMSANGIAGFKMDALMRIVRAVEAHHFGIKQKEQA